MCCVVRHLGRVTCGGRVPHCSKWYDVMRLCVRVGGVVMGICTQSRSHPFSGWVGGGEGYM